MSQNQYDEFGNVIIEEYVSEEVKHLAATVAARYAAKTGFKNMLGSVEKNMKAILPIILEVLNEAATPEVKHGI